MLPRGRRRSLLAAAMGLLLSMGVALPAYAVSDVAKPAGDPRPAAATGGVAATLQTALGGSFAGSWLEPGSAGLADLVVATTDPAAVPRVRTAGAQPRLVSRNLVALDGIMTALNSRSSSAPDAVTGWYIDPASNSVVVSTTDDAAARAFASGQDGVRIEHVNARPVPMASLHGGDTMTSSSGGRCSVGFNAISGGVRYIITAGHCTKTGGTWSGPNGNEIGPVVKSSFPGSDFGLVEVASSAWEQTNDVEASRGNVTVMGTTPAPVGSRVCLSGSVSGYHCGQVKALGETVNYGGGDVVHGLTRTTVCAEAGDSGGPFMSGGQAQGMLSGGSGGCLLGGQSYFQPIDVVLSTYGLTLLTGGSAAAAEAASDDD